MVVFSRRVFAIDILLCQKCGGEMKLLAYLTEPTVVQKILLHLGLPTQPRPLSPARWPVQLELLDTLEDPQLEQKPRWPTHRSPNPGSRGPPKPGGEDAVTECVEPVAAGEWEA